MIAGCRAETRSGVRVPGGLGFRYSIRYNVRPTLSLVDLILRFRNHRYRASSVGSVEPPVLHRCGRFLEPHCHVHTTDRSFTASREVLVPFSACRSCCVIRRRPASGPSRFDVQASRVRQIPPEVVDLRIEFAMTVVLAVFPPCAPRAPGPRRACFVTGHTGPVPGHSPRSLFRAAFRYPLDQTLSRPGRIVERDPETLMGLLALRSVPRSAGPRISAVHPHMPLAWICFRRAGPMIFTGCRSRTFT